ncbi:chemotaxis protein CheW [Castellaniella sp.]|uniref:chemotaxis protein CheW n=1 Tax=Castellaniella sp. TaxID=1955812 RepID=UPI003560F93B
MNSVHTTSRDDSALDHEFLVFALAQQEYGIDILKVQEIRGYDEHSVTRIANVPSFIKGVTNLRGVIVPVVDLRVRLNLEQVRYDEHTVVIILNIHSRVVGIVVDAVSDVQTLKPAQISAAPQFGSAFAAEYLTGIGTADDRMLILIDIEALMTSRDMALIDHEIEHAG